MIGTEDKRSSAPSSVTRVRFPYSLMWVVALRVFLRVLRFLVSPQKSTNLNSNSIWTSRPPLITVLATKGVISIIVYQSCRRKHTSKIKCANKTLICAHLESSNNNLLIALILKFEIKLVANTSLQYIWLLNCLLFLSHACRWS